MTGSTATKQINLDLTGKSQLELVVTNGGDNLDYDHADWAGARITCGGTGGNQPPVVTISSPTAATTFAVGDLITYQGSATDPQDGTLTGSSLSWQINIQHCIGTSCHIHYFMTVPGSGGSFTVPDHGDMFHFDLTLTATDSAGLSSSSTISIYPRTINLTLATNPTGLQVVTGGTQSTSPFTTTQVQGATVTIYAASPQNGLTFSSWSDGGLEQHNVTLGTTNATYTATFGSSPSFAVTGVSPTDGSTGVAPSTNVTATFATDIDQTTLTSSTFTLQQGANPPVGGALSYNSSTRTVTLDPSSDLQAGQTYTATITTGLKDTSGNTLASAKSWAFTVANSGGGGGSGSLSVTDATPSDGSTGVAPSTNVTATFATDIDQTTLTSSTFTLQQGANPPVGGALSYNSSTRTVTLDPSSDLQAGQTYTATITTGLKDTSGNSLASPKIWTFTVASGGVAAAAVRPATSATSPGRQRRAAGDRSRRTCRTGSSPPATANPSP